jgi:hypothetical protein
MSSLGFRRPKPSRKGFEDPFLVQIVGQSFGNEWFIVDNRYPLSYFYCDSRARIEGKLRPI